MPPETPFIIQALRAFRRAEIIFDVVLFERCVGGVAVAMTLASIFHFEFWFLWGVVLGSFLGVFWKPLRVVRASLGLLWGSFGGPWAHFLGPLECFWLLRRAMGFLWESLEVPGTSLGVSGMISGIFWEAFWLLFG